MNTPPQQCSGVADFDAWYAKTSIDPYDDRVRPLLLAAAGKRDARDWDLDDAEAVISFLLSRNDAETTLTAHAQALLDAGPLIMTREEFNRICAKINARAKCREIMG